MHLLIQLHTIIQFQNHNSAILHLLCASLPFSPSASYKRRAGRKGMPKDATSTAEGKIPSGRLSAADCSILSVHDDFIFLRQNDYWIIRYDGHTAFLKSMHGLRYLAVLLCNSGREFHV